jgi:hypothetical protein
MLRFSPRSPAGAFAAEIVKTKLEPFGHPGENPVRAEIARLREQRDDGIMSETDFAVRVAELLGAFEPPSAA